MSNVLPSEKKLIELSFPLEGRALCNGVHCECVLRPTHIKTRATVAFATRALEQLANAYSADALLRSANVAAQQRQWLIEFIDTHTTACQLKNHKCAA
jgi:hypothetical protein